MEWTVRVESARKLDRDRVLIEVTVAARGKSSDVELSEHRWCVVTVSEGRVMRTEGYASSEDALEAAGLSE